MTDTTQPLGATLPNWQAIQHSFASQLSGQYCSVSKLDITSHAQGLYQAFSADQTGSMWTYLPYGGFADFAAFEAWLNSYCTQRDPLFYVISDEKPLGLASYARIDVTHGVVEIAHLAFSPALQRTRLSTEALFLMIDHAFALGYRRVEWKCNSLNAPSKAAALRLGMTFEGVFRQAMVLKGHNRDTAWFSLLDSEWKALRPAFQQWLAPSNFDDADQQRQALSAFTSIVNTYDACRTSRPSAT